MPKLYTDAVCFSRPGAVEILKRVRLSEIGSDGIYLKTELSAISRGTETDVLRDRSHEPSASSHWYPLLPGYLMTGRVLEVGPAVRHLKAGDRVVGGNLKGGFPSHLCVAWGGHCSYHVINRKSHPRLGSLRAVRIPANVTDNAACLSLLAAVALRGVDRLPISKDSLVLIVGLGLLGQFVAQHCKIKGAGRVVCVDPHRSRLETAALAGADSVIRGRLPQKGIEGRIRDECGGIAPTLAVDTTGCINSLLTVLGFVSPFGHVHALGTYLEKLTFSVQHVMSRRNLTFSASAGETPDDVAACLSLMAKGKLRTMHFSHLQMAYDSAPRAYALIESKPDNTLTAFLKWH